MIVRSDNFYLFLIFASVVSSFIFCTGFFPYSIVKQEKSEKIFNGNSAIDKSVIMIIDALRLDFLDSESFSYVHKLLEEKEACLLKLKVSLPTVTKPRIKALTSGTIPSFLDVAMNFGDDEMKIDTFLHQFRMRNEKIVFAGDDTWRMFKNMFVREYANKDSLFVNDFYEGDKNVTAALQVELKKQDWKLLILHYLGLDHIGHVEGPFSKLVPPKLKEMNDAIKFIHEKLKEFNKSSSKKSILIVSGDHGMRDSGGHSGNSFAETHVPLLVIGCDCESNRDKFYQQIDFAGTFSILNGLPVPSSSIGSVIPELLVNMTQLEKLETLRIVNQRLLNMIQADCDGSEEFKLQFQKAKSFHEMFTKNNNNKNAFLQAEANYLTSSRAISDQLGRKSQDVNLFQVLLGLTVNILICVTILIPCDGLTKDLKMSAGSFVPFVIGGFLLKIFVTNEVFQQSNSFGSFFVMIVMSAVLRIVFGIISAKIERFKWSHLFENDLLYLLILGHTFFVISVGSSSFVEEEHQIWYYFCSSMFVFLTFLDFKNRKTVKSVFNVTGKCFSFLLMHVVIRRMNQTGDKWINIPDIGDWLHREENHLWLQFMVICSLVASAAWIVFFHSHSSIMFFVVIAHALLNFHHTRSIANRNDLPITTLFWLNLAVIIAIDVARNFKAQSKNFHFFVYFYLVSLLLHQPQNIVMAFGCAFTCWFLNQACNRVVKNSAERTIAKVFLHVWTGKLFYFYQGNSNSLSTIDVNAGFVGQMHVHLPIIFIFSTINTFNGQLLSLFLLVQHLNADSKRLNDDTGFCMRLLFKWMSLLTIIPTTVFLVVITILRHHLFIWSVFSPKLLYDFFVSALMLISLLIVKMTNKF